MSEKNGDKESKPLLYVDQVKISDQRGNMQSDFRTKKATPKDSVEPEPELQEAEQKEEKIEKARARCRSSESGNIQARQRHPAQHERCHQER